jgi:hypothetical protein
MSLRDRMGLRARDQMGHLVEHKGTRAYGPGPGYGSVAVRAVAGRRRIEEEPWVADAPERIPAEVAEGTVATVAELGVNGVKVVVTSEQSAGEGQVPEQLPGPGMPIGPMPEAGL